MKPENQLSYTPGGRALDTAVFGFAVFTLLCHVAVGLQLGLDTLIQISILALLLGIGVRIGWGRRDPRTEPTTRAASSPNGIPTLSGLSLLILALVGVGLHWGLDSIWGYWVCAAVGCVIVLARETRSHPQSPEVQVGRFERTSLWGLGVLCALTALAAHHGDADDAFYVNLSVWALDHPDAPLLPGDTLHGFDGIAMSLPVFKLLSYEIFQAAFARLSGLPALDVVHLCFPPLIALLIPFVWARLASLLVPSRWLIVVGLMIAQLFFLGDGHASYGDFGLLRLQQGKTVLLLIALPLIAYYGIRFGLAPSLSRGLLLAAAQIAAVGLSTTALWLGPTTGFLAVCAATTLGDTHWLRTGRTVLLGLMTSLYPLALALFMRSATLRAFSEAVHPLPSLEWSSHELMTHALDLLAGPDQVARLILFCLIAVLAIPGTALFRRYMAVTVGAFFLFFFDPWLARFVSHQITGADTYFRVFWVLPLPLIIASVLSAPLAVGTSLPEGRRRGLTVATCVGALALLIWLPGTHTLSSANEVRLGWPGPKVPIRELAMAQRVVETSHEGDFILTPPLISRWIPLFQDHPAPLMVRAMYLDRLHERLGAEELIERRLLTQLVGGQTAGGNGPERLAGAVSRYPLNAVLLSGPALANPELRRILIDSPLSVDFRDADYELWVRKKGPDSSER